MKSVNPWCVECLKHGLHTPWSELDHIIPLEQGGDDTVENMQGLCDRHHKLKTANDRGYKRTPGADSSGDPTDETHPWNRGDHEP